ncbi:WxL domain-containing protein [Carnobacterium divergens]|uniref:WxL domain-containing protein n=1 Tax=Carnobacterium divergens TaxID=2748 RepID=A0A7Z8D071_CARDV|nr:WxL domain-containing protein [Carnobacterium divergens]MPQ22973.1 WxL domain-containing protein [Carnobacterium divergens]TFI74466.1 WxL domain-containing protein [Carnobacterium divergens]TFI78788.1 WxL domain-containing protein [Carnobacterium divergens]TFI85347.1 WxL domain-containing protein [Carnobacterium divergens]TFI97703.1 WxL domain-containing protein [Carnobacterium divergens]
MTLKKHTVSCLVIASLLLGTKAYAETLDTIEQKSATSNAYATFKEYEGPEGQYKLHISSLTDINFGSQMMEGDRKVYDAKFNQNEDHTFSATNIVTVDNRGTNAGWELKLSNTQFSTADESIAENARVLNGAKLSFHSADYSPLDGNTSKLPPSLVASSKVLLNNQTEVEAFVLDGSGTLAPIIIAEGEKIDENGHNIEGQLGEGIGTWMSEFGSTPKNVTATSENSAIKLEIPGSTKKSKNVVYNSVLTWELSDAP